ncbi:hypothetical protein [Leptolyngbya sp. GGD]|uniref:hypothetical protein n=1 Tax=Leptolyngbya sp. GGD TaxID=2997907 RepID=UPI00227A7269|nr:hypothetical protein [Leptolyngbya sp. GGD]MCY6488907.1 hypothetical protein [Leptolyngbya sp. GGD]
MPIYASPRSHSAVNLFHPANRQQRWKLWSLLFLLLSGLSACTASEAQSVRSKGDRSVPVVSTQASRQTMPILVQTTGTVQTYSTIALKSQMDGHD